MVGWVCAHDAHRNYCAVFEKQNFLTLAKWIRLESSAALPGNAVQDGCGQVLTWVS